MDRSVLNKYKKEDEKLVLSKVMDKISFCETKNKIQVTDFFDLGQKQLIYNFLNSQKVKNYIFYGGFEEAERVLAVFYPEKLEDLTQNINFNEYIKVIRITLPNENKGKYTHQNYLGALMKLGLKREKIGDILVDENGADIIIKEDILKFLITNLSQLTRFQKSEIEEIKLEELRKAVIQKEKMTITVSSMRIDNIVAELAKCSRNKANELLEQERVFVNYEVITKPTKQIKENDKITIRGKGRFEVKQILGNTRKGRIMVEIEK